MENAEVSREGRGASGLTGAVGGGKEPNGSPAPDRVRNTVVRGDGTTPLLISAAIHLPALMLLPAIASPFLLFSHSNTQK